MNFSRLARQIETTEKSLRFAERHDLHVPRRDIVVNDLRRMSHNLDCPTWVVPNR